MVWIFLENCHCIVNNHSLDNPLAAKFSAIAVYVFGNVKERGGWRRYSDMILIAMDNCHMTARNGVLESTSAAKSIAIAL